MKDHGIASPERSSCAASRPVAINANPVTRNQKIRPRAGGASQTPIRPASAASSRSCHPATRPKRLWMIPMITRLQPTRGKVFDFMLKN